MSNLCPYDEKKKNLGLGENEDEKQELHWERDGSWIFGGIPVACTGKEYSVLFCLNLLKNLEIGKKVLSVGCAIAADLKLLKKTDFVTVGLDPESRFLLKGKAEDNADDFIKAIGENIPLYDGSFDLVLLIEVLEHVMKPEVVLEEIVRVLKPNGILFLTVPNRFYPFETHGIQFGQARAAIGMLGLGIPFFSLAPDFLRRRFERARIYSEAGIVSLLKNARLQPFVIEYMMPPLDRRQQTTLTRATRKVFLSLSKVPIIKRFGVSIIVLCKKTRKSGRC